MKNLGIITLALVFILTSCAKQISSLPEASQTGANSFGSKIDGGLWGPMKLGIIPTAPILEARFSADNTIFINARNFAASPNESEMEICLKNVIKPGIIQLNQSTAVYPSESASYAHFVRRKVTPVNEWITSPQFTGWVNVTRIDRDSRIISGTFEFEAGNFFGSASPITVTEGRFDVTIQ